MYSTDQNTYFYYSNQEGMNSQFTPSTIMDQYSMPSYNNVQQYNCNQYQVPYQSQPLPSFTEVLQTPQIMSQGSQFPTFSQMFQNNDFNNSPTSNSLDDYFECEQFTVENNDGLFILLFYDLN